jgi:hypothetical protein
MAATISSGMKVMIIQVVRKETITLKDMLAVADMSDD